LAALLCVAGGVLTKWTAPAFFYGTVIPLLWLRGRLRLLWCRQHLVCALIGASLCLSWMVAAVMSVGWDTFYFTVSREALMRLSPSHHHRPYPWDETLTHPLRILIGAVPVSVYAVLTLRRGFGRRCTAKDRRLLQAFHCWVWPNLLFWSLIPEHSVRHSFPLYPGIAGLAVLYWTRRRVIARSRPLSDRSRARLVRGLAALLVAWMMVKLVFVHAVVPARMRGREARDKAEQIAALVPPSETLYLSMLKDEGIMFYYGRTVRRVADLARLTSSAGAAYCILDDTEWKSWQQQPGVELLAGLRDGQGAPIALVRAGRGSKP
jgi:4-amino-4-deoxy-L-arabinose transferase-like glycosyltransferase